MIKGIFDYFYVPQVLLHELSLFFICFSDLVQASLEDDDWIRKLRAFGGLALLNVLLVALLGVVVDQLAVLLVVEAHLQLLDIVLEQLFILLMLGLKRNDLVVGFLGDF